MKKRKVMALLLAVALAVPNAGIVTEIANMPAATVEAAVASTPIEITVDPAVNSTISSIQSQLDALFVNPIPMEPATIAKNKIKVGSKTKGEWSLLNPDQVLKCGNNEIGLRFTFNEGEIAEKNGWETDKDEKGRYSHDFTVNVVAAEEVVAADILADAWPELGEKTYDAAKVANMALWADDVSKASSKYGTFSIEKTNNGGSAVVGSANQVKVTFKLNPGYVFKTASADGTNNIGAIAAGDTTCVKEYSNLTVSRKEITETDLEKEWPELSWKSGHESALYNETVTSVVELSKAVGYNDGTNDVVKFELWKEDKSAKINTEKFTAQENNFLIKAEIASAANYEFSDSQTAYWKPVSVQAEMPKMTAVTISNDSSEVEGSIQFGSGAKDSVLKAAAKWNITDTKTTPTTGLYDYDYQWYKDGEKIIEVGDPDECKVTLDSMGSGEYYCEITATLKDNATVADTKVWPAQQKVKSDVVIVAVSDIAVDAPATVAYDGGNKYSGAPYGSLKTNVEYTGELGDVTKDAEVELVVKDASKQDITKDVAGKVTLEKGTPTTVPSVSAKGTYKYKVTVDKSADAGTYNCYLKVTDQGQTVVLNPTIACVIDQQKVAVDKTKIYTLNDATYGDKYESLEFGYGTKPTALDAEKAISEKINISLNSKTGATPFTEDYLTVGESGNNVLVNVELKEDYKKNYQIDFTGGNAITQIGGSTYLGTADVAVTVNPMDLELSVKDIEIVKGEGLPKFEIIGLDKCKEEDKITAAVNEYTLYKKSDTNQTPIKNNIKKLEAGEYIIGFGISDIVIDSEEDAKGNNFGTANYSVTPKNANLTIYESMHTISFVSNGGSEVADQRVGHNAAGGTMPAPARSGYKFAGWYMDKNLTQAYDPAAKVTKDLMLFAKWEKAETTTPGTSGNTGASGNAAASGNQAAPVVKNGTTAKTKAGTFVVTNASAKTVAYKAASKSAKKVTIPSTVKINGANYKVTKVGDKAFYNCKKLTKVAIPSTVTEIGKSAFQNCKKLTSVTLPSKVTKIGKSAFQNCTKLKKVTIKSKKVKSIGKNAFKNIARKSVIKTPKGKKAAYKKMLKKSGYKKTVK